MTSVRPSVELVSTGRSLPDRVLTNKDLEGMVETSDEWIRERTGIRERRIAAEGTLTADLGATAAEIALSRAEVPPEEVDILLLSTATPDRWLPSTSCDIQSKVGATNAFASDLHAACSGFLYNLSLAEAYLAMGRGEVALVIGAEVMSSIIDWEDRATCVLFGDGAGAAVLRRSDTGRGILANDFGSDGTLADLLCRPAGGVQAPLDKERLIQKDHLVHMSGREIFKAAVRAMADSSARALEKAGLTPDDVDLMVPHQANIRILEATARYAGIPMEKVYVNLDRYGNMSSATIPVALDECLEQGLIKPGSVVLSAAFGAGLTWGATVFQF